MIRYQSIILKIVAVSALLVSTAQASITPASPDVTIVPVFQTNPPSNLPPAYELPTGAYAVGLYSAIIAQANSSYEQPTSPAPALPNCSGYNLNKYSWYWPTVAQSQTWWAAQPGAPASGTEAYTIGITISHQQQEGWQLSGGCVYDPQPYCGGAGYTNNYYWGGQFTGWLGSCNYTPPPSCPNSAGWTGSYSWNGSSWVSGCRYQSQPSCPTSAGWTGSYSWNGFAWVSGCRYQSQPSCPSGYGGSYSWNGSSWVDQCTAPVVVAARSSGGAATAACPAGDTIPSTYQAGYICPVLTMSLMIDAEGAYQPDTYNGTWPMTNPVSTIGGVNYTIIGEHGYYEPQVGVSMRYSVGHTVVGQYYCSYDERRINKSYFWGNMLMVNAPPGCP